jgi:hypothetical protein
MKAVIESLMSNVHPQEDEVHLHSERDPSDDFGWFSVRVGTADGIGTTDFQVVVATPRATPRAEFPGNTRFKGLVLQSYSPDAARDLIHSKVEETEGRDYSAIIEKLRAFMFWEYDNYRP